MLSDDAFKGIAKSKGKCAQDHRTAILNILDAVEEYLLTGETEEAIQLLTNLRMHVDGDPNADNNDWILDDTSRLQVRDLIDLLLNNLSS